MPLIFRRALNISPVSKPSRVLVTTVVTNVPKGLIPRRIVPIVPPTKH